MLSILKIVVSLTFFALSLFATEWTVRLVKNREVNGGRTDIIGAEYMPTRLRPFYEGQVMGLPLKTNQFGFRDRADLTKTPAAGEIRILALGDSVGLGLGVTPEQHYTGHLEAGLNRRLRQGRVEVINAAGQGYSPSNYLVYLKNEGLEFDPDLVLVQIELCNDVSDEALLSWKTSGPDGALQAVRGGRYVVTWDGNLVGSYTRGPFFFEKTYTYTLLVRRFASLLDWVGADSAADVAGSTYFAEKFEKPFLSAGRIEVGWNQLIGALKQTRELLDRHNIRLRVLVIPSRYMFEDGPTHRLFASKLYRRALDSLRTDEIPVVEVLDALKEQGGASLYLDFAHPTRQGNQVIGNVLVQDLAGLLPVESR